MQNAVNLFVVKFRYFARSSLSVFSFMFIPSSRVVVIMCSILRNVLLYSSCFGSETSWIMQWFFPCFVTSIPM